MAVALISAEAAGSGCVRRDDRPAATGLLLDENLLPVARRWTLGSEYDHAGW